jgi:phosphotransferase system IIB component
VDVGACTTRLRVQIKDSKKVSETKLKQTGALGFVRPSPISVQVIYGLQADAIKEKVNDHLKEDEK